MCVRDSKVQWWNADGGASNGGFVLDGGKVISYKAAATTELRGKVRIKCDYNRRN
jgi:hypothetical protein